MEAPKIPQQPTAAAGAAAGAAAAAEGGILASMSNAISGTAAPTAPSVPVSAAAPAAAAPAPDGTATATQATQSAINSVKDSFAAMTSGGSDSIFYLIVIVFLVAAIIAYFLYYFITDNILYQQKLDVDGTEVPIICNELSEFKITKVLPNSNGIKRTYGFWIYINDINKYAGKFRHIAHLGDNAAHIKGGCPYIFLDNHTNSVHVRFAPKKEPKSMTEFDTLNEIPDVDSLLTYDGKRCGITIQYVPVQRWVHIVIVVSDFNGGIVYTYIDGELAEVDNARERKLVLHELDFENRVGSLFVGGSVSNTTVNATGFSGLLSKFSIYNYDLNKNDIYKEYSRGPLNGLLTSMGIVSYGLRNPVYKLNAVY